MKKGILIILGILSMLYGLLVLRVGSGTLFWLFWEAIGLFFVFWAYLLHKSFFETHKKIRILFRVMTVAAVVVLVTFCGMIAGEFTAEGEPGLDYIIVLGAQVREDGPSVVLKYRLDAAKEYLNENPDTVCIVSGGQGINEPFSEAEGMADYLIKNGIAKDRILLEDKATSTVENIKNSKAYMKIPYNGVGIVTNNFHIFRAVQIAKRQGLANVCGIAAGSNMLYLPNNMLRECGGILKDWIFSNQVPEDEMSLEADQPVRDKDAIYVMENESEWGLELQVTDITPEGLTIECTQSGGNPIGELQTGSYYIVEKKLWTSEDQEILISKCFT